MGLLSPVFKACTKKAFTIGSFCGTHPFEWNKLSNSPQVTTKWRKLMLWRLNVTITYLYALFLGVRCFQVVSSEDSEFSSAVKIYMIFISLLFSFPVVHQWVFIQRKRELVLFYKQTFTLFDQLSQLLNETRGRVAFQNGGAGESGESGCEMPKLLDLCLPVLWNLCFIFCTFVGVLAVLIPNSPEMISSVILPEAGIWRWILLVPCALFQFHYLLLYAVNGIFYLALFFGFVFPEFVVLRQIKRWFLAAHARNIPRDRIKKMLKMYRQLGILQEFFHNWACTMIFPFFKTLMMIWVVLGVCGFFRMSGLFSVLLGFFSCTLTILLVVMVAACAELHEKSKQILYLLKSYDVQKCLTPYEKKTGDSFRLIKIQMRSSYFIDKLYVLTVIKVVSDSTVSFLVAHV